jgi:ABC-type transport system substrate-binding protein
MMIRSLLISLAFGTALACVQAAPSYAQTTETDQSEEDWRKSRKKRSTTPDIFDPNVNGIGQGLPY